MSALFTVDELERIPDPPGGRYELHHGELYFKRFRERRYGDIQRSLRDLLDPICAPLGFLADTNYPYRPLPESELWGADVACIRRSRERGVEKWLIGSPELVIEVKHPSVTTHEVHAKAMLTLCGEGVVAFWAIDPETQTVTVYTRDGMQRYAASESIPIDFLDCSICLAEIL